MYQLDVAPQAILSASPLFAALAPESLQLLADASMAVVVRRNGTICRAGDTPSCVYLVISGRVKRSVTSYDGGEKILDVLGPGAVFGDAELFGHYPCTSFAVAVEAVQLLRIRGEVVRRTAGVDAEFAQRLIETMAQRQSELERHIVDRRFRSGKESLLDYFLGLTDGAGGEQTETRISLPLSKRLIAAHIGITPETLSRCLRELSGAGLVVVKGRHISLQNKRIAEYLADHCPPPSVSPEMPIGRRRTDAAEGLSRRAAGRAGLAARRPASAGSPGAIINHAGRQRMLSQRMARSWLMLGCGILPEQARNNLEQAIAEFEEQLFLLAQAPQHEPVSQALATLQDTWLPYKSLLHCAPGKSCASLIFEQSEKVLAAAQDLTLAVEAAADTPSGHLINVAGRQRMLSQRIPKLMLFRHWDVHTEVGAAIAQASRREFETAFDELLAAAREALHIRQPLANVSRHWTQFRVALAVPGDAASLQRDRKVIDASERLLAEMDVVVTLLEKQDG